MGLADTFFKPAGERTLGDKSIIAAPNEELGRIVIGAH